MTNANANQQHYACAVVLREKLEPTRIIFGRSPPLSTVQKAAFILCREELQEHCYSWDKNLSGWVGGGGGGGAGKWEWVGGGGGGRGGRVEDNKRWKLLLTTWWAGHSPGYGSYFLFHYLSAAPNPSSSFIFPFLSLKLPYSIFLSRFLFHHL